MSTPKIHQTPLSRRHVMLGASALGLLGLSACAGEKKTGQQGSNSSSSWKPVTVTHKYGTTTVEKEPKRVVTVGLTEQDFLLSLGVIPVATTFWYGENENNIWPWQKKALGDAKPTVLRDSDGIQFGEIAKLQPDLIIALNSGLKKPDYEKLSKLAPTVAPAGDTDFFDDWRVYLEKSAEAVGKNNEGKKIKSEIEGKFSQAAAENPQFKGKKVIFLQGSAYKGSLIASMKSNSSDFVTNLGFEVPSDINKFAKTQTQAYIPLEQISVLNSADVLIWGTEKDEDKAALEKIPGFKDLKAVKNNASIYTGGELAGQIYFNSPLSIPLALDQLVPKLKNAVK